MGNLDENVVQNGVGVLVTLPVLWDRELRARPRQARRRASLRRRPRRRGQHRSQVRAAMRDEPGARGSGVAYSGYTVFAGELAYDSPDNGEVGYKVYIGPNQYFVITV